MIQIRNVPDDLHRRLKARAALAGFSLSEYLLHELKLIMETPTLQEFSKDITWHGDEVAPSAAELVREDRGPL